MSRAQTGPPAGQESGPAFSSAAPQPAPRPCESACEPPAPRFSGSAPWDAPRTGVPRAGWRRALRVERVCWPMLRAHRALDAQWRRRQKGQPSDGCRVSWQRWEQSLGRHQRPGSPHWRGATTSRTGIFSPKPRSSSHQRADRQMKVRAYPKGGLTKSPVRRSSTDGSGKTWTVTFDLTPLRKPIQGGLKPASFFIAKRSKSPEPGRSLVPQIPNLRSPNLKSQIPRKRPISDSGPRSPIARRARPFVSDDHRGCPNEFDLLAPARVSASLILAVVTAC